MPIFVSGNLLDSNEQYIVHQCNCITTHSKGLSTQIFRAYPEADTYSRNDTRKPGTIHVFDKVINLYGQKYPGKSRSHSIAKQRLHWFQKGLFEILELNPVSVAFPFKIGCGLAGGKWEHYLRLIELFEVSLCEKNPEANVVIYKL
jgi:O-acetyl-ADP-ribose deacetylase (regulator of RNase III)